MDDRYERVSTFTRWPSLAQLASYFFSAFQIVVFYMLIQHNYVNKLLQIVFNTILAICLSIQVISTVLCSAADPVDPILL